MIEQELILKNIKSELLTLYIHANEGYKSFNTYFQLFQQSVFKFFDIKKTNFFIVQDHLLKPTDPSVSRELFRNGIDWAKFEFYFEIENIVQIPEIFNREPFSQFDRMMIIRKNNNEPFGIIFFKSTPSWQSFANSSYINEFLVAVSKLFITI